MYLTLKNSAFGLMAALLTCFSSNAFAATSNKCPGETGYYNTNYRLSQNPKHGGFVSDSAFVDDRAFIAPTAAVCGSATVLDKARVYGNAVIKDEAEVSGDARVYGNAVVSDTAQVRGNAKVSANATIKGDAIIEGTAWIQGYSVVTYGTHFAVISKALKPQSVIDAENRLAAAERARIAQEKVNALARKNRKEAERKANCKSDWYAKEARLERAYASAKCNHACQNDWENPSSRRRAKASRSAYADLQAHKETSVFRLCR